MWYCLIDSCEDGWALTRHPGVQLHWIINGWSGSPSLLLQFPISILSLRHLSGFFVFFSLMSLLKVNHNGILGDININVLFRGKVEWKENSRSKFEACWVQGATCDIISPLGVVVLHVCCNKPAPCSSSAASAAAGGLDLHWANKDLNSESGPSHVVDVVRWEHVMSPDLPYSIIYMYI